MHNEEWIRIEGKLDLNRKLIDQYRKQLELDTDKYKEDIYSIAESNMKEAIDKKLENYENVYQSFKPYFGHEDLRA